MNWWDRVREKPDSENSMISKATVYLTQDRSKAVPAGDPDARVKLVHQGQEIPQAVVMQYPGAIELVGGTKEASKGEEIIVPEREFETQEVESEHRDPTPHKRFKKP